MADFSAPDFSVPPLAPGQPGRPELVLPDPTLPDPPVPALLQPAAPADLELPPVAHPDPPSPDLIAPELPPDLRLCPPAEHNSGEEPPGIQAILSEPAATLAPALPELLRASPDRQHLPPDLHYDETRTTQDGMTHRLRHLAPLLLALQGETRGMEVPHDC